MKLYSGDVCFIIRPDLKPSSVVCLFFASMVGHAIGRRAEVLYWVFTQSLHGKNRRLIDPYVKISAAVSVKILPIWKSGRRKYPCLPSKSVSNQGTLPNGDDTLFTELHCTLKASKEIKVSQIRLKLKAVIYFLLGKYWNDERQRAHAE